MEHATRSEFKNKSITNSKIGRKLRKNDKISTVRRCRNIDFGDGCWGRNVLVTSLRCW